MSLTEVSPLVLSIFLGSTQTGSILENALRAGIVGGILAGLLFAIKYGFQLAFFWNKTKGTSAESSKNVVRSKSSNRSSSPPLTQPRYSQPEHVYTPKATRDVQPENSLQSVSTLANGPSCVPKPPAFNMNQGLSQSPHNLSFYERLAAEKSSGTRLESLWLKCFTEADGDTVQAELAYNAARVALLEQEAAEVLHAQRAERARVLINWRSSITAILARLESYLTLPPNSLLSGRDAIAAVHSNIQTSFLELQRALATAQGEMRPEEWHDGNLNQSLVSVMEDVLCIHDREQAWSGTRSCKPLAWPDFFALVQGHEKWNNLKVRVDSALADHDLMAMWQHHWEVLKQANEKFSKDDLVGARRSLPSLSADRFKDLDYSIILTLANSEVRRNHIFLTVAIIVAVAVAILLSYL